MLRRDLLSATTTVEKCALVTALGNAGVATDIVVIARFTQDTEGPVAPRRRSRCARRTSRRYAGLDMPSSTKLLSVTSASAPPPPPPLYEAQTPRMMKAMKLTAPQTAYIAQPPLTVPEGCFEDDATMVSQAPTVVNQAPLAQTMMTAFEPTTLQTPPAPSPSGAYRLVNPGDGVGRFARG